MPGSNVPTPTFGPNGFVAPLESDILTGVQADMQAAFNGALNFTTTAGAVTNPTPQAQLADAQTAIIGDKNDKFLALANGVDPAFADGRMQDAIARIYFLDRIQAASTVTQVLCSGLVNVPIPVGALLQASDQNLYSCIEAGTIPAGGSITLSFACIAMGPIACPAQTFKIYQTIPGWDSAASSDVGVLGKNVETRSAFETRRSASVALNGRNTMSAIRANLLSSVAGVLDAYCIDNPTSSPVTTGGVTLPANSMYAAVVGGLAADVAQAIWAKKPPGIPMNGNTTVTVLDNNSGYSTPPIYSITFEIPASLPYCFLVTLKNSTSVPSTALASLQAALVAAFAGQDDGPPATIGSTSYASRFYAAVAGLGTWVQLISVTIGQFSAASGSASTIAGTTLTVGGTVTGTFAVGQIISGPNVLTPTIITALGSGTGGAGTYTVRDGQTAASGAISAALMGNSVTAQINQVPTLPSGNILLSLV